MPLDPATRTIVDQMAAGGPVDFSDLSPDAFRHLFRASLGALDQAGSADPEEDAEDRSIPGPAGPLRIRVYRPRGIGAQGAPDGGAGTAPAPPLVTYFHGGGWVIGDIDTHDGSCRILSRRTGAVVVSVDYRLAPEHPFPAAIDDCDAAVTWVADHARDLGGDPGHLGVAGDSAGGNLAAAVTLRARERRGPAIAAQALVYPAVDFTTVRPSQVANGEGYLLTASAIRWFAAQYLGDHDPFSPNSPAYPRRWWPRPSSTPSATKAGPMPKRCGTPGSASTISTSPGSSTASWASVRSPPPRPGPPTRSGPLSLASSPPDLLTRSPPHPLITAKSRVGSSMPRRTWVPISVSRHEPSGSNWWRTSAVTTTAPSSATLTIRATRLTRGPT